MILKVISRSKLFSRSFPRVVDISLCLGKRQRIEVHRGKFTFRGNNSVFFLKSWFPPQFFFLTFSDCGIAGQEPHRCPLSRIDRFWLLNTCALHLQFHHVDHQRLTRGFCFKLLKTPLTNWCAGQAQLCWTVCPDSEKPKPKPIPKPIKNAKCEMQKAYWWWTFHPVHRGIHLTLNR